MKKINFGTPKFSAFLINFYSSIDGFSILYYQFGHSTNRLSAPIGAPSRYLSSSNVLSRSLLSLLTQSQTELRLSAFRKTSASNFENSLEVFLSAKIATHSSTERGWI